MLKMRLGAVPDTDVNMPHPLAYGSRGYRELRITGRSIVVVDQCVHALDKRSQKRAWQLVMPGHLPGRIKGRSASCGPVQLVPRGLASGRLWISPTETAGQFPRWVDIAQPATTPSAVSSSMTPNMAN